MADRTTGRGSRDGIYGAVLATGLGSPGAVLEADLPEAGRRRVDVGNAASGASTIEPRTAGAQERFPRCRTSGETTGSPGANPELCTRCRAASLADSDAQKVPVNAQSGAVTEPTGGSTGRDPHQVVQPGFGSVGGQRTAHAEGGRRWRNRSGGPGSVGRQEV